MKRRLGRWGGADALRALVVSAVCVFVASGHAQAQIDDLSAYYLNLASRSGRSPLGGSGVADFQRFRLMTGPSLGPVGLDVAYEHTLQVSSRDVTNPGAVILLPTAGVNWLDLDWTEEESEHVLWRHRLDRLALTLPVGESTEISMGRQVVSWASTLILTPADPFTPFDPADPFREYRAGVDAARVRAYPGAFSEVDIIVRPTTSSDGDQLTALVRGKTNWRGWDVAAWGGVLFDDAAGAVSAVGAWAGWAVRTEVAVRDDGNRSVLRGTVGLDRRFAVRGRDLYVIVEYQHDGFGAADADDLFQTTLSAAFQRGELQLLARDALATQASYQIQPLWALDLLALTSLSDGSVLLSGGGTWGFSSNSSLRGGTFVGFGDDSLAPIAASAAAPTGIGSEFGLTPSVLYLSLTHFF